MYQTTQTSLQWLDKVADCHMACFPESFSTRLGKRYSARSLQWFLAADNRFLFHIEYDGQVVGYCGGFQSEFVGDGSTSGMLQYAMWEAVKGVLKRPSLLFHRQLFPYYSLIAKNVFRRFTGRKKRPAEVVKGVSGQRSYGLVVIGVHPDYRGSGCFQELMVRFERECRTRNAESAGLTVKPSNKRAIAAYLKCGWTVVSESAGSVHMQKNFERRNGETIDSCSGAVPRA